MAVNWAATMVALKAAWTAVRWAAARAGLTVDQKDERSAAY